MPLACALIAVRIAWLLLVTPTTRLKGPQHILFASPCLLSLCPKPNLFLHFESLLKFQTRRRSNFQAHFSSFLDVDVHPFTAMRLLLQNLVATAVLSSFMANPAASSSSLDVTIVSHTSPMTISSEPPRECSVEGASVMMTRAGAVGELYTALRSASITYSLVPSVPCSVLAVLPSSLQDDFADLETRWYNWWQTERCVADFILHVLPLTLSAFPCFSSLPLCPSPRFPFLMAYFSPWTNVSDVSRVAISDPTSLHGLQLAWVNIRETLAFMQANFSTLPRAWTTLPRGLRIVQNSQGRVRR